MESLDEGANTELQDFEEDPDFLVTLSEAEAWSVTVDKKVCYSNLINCSYLI